MLIVLNIAQFSEMEMMVFIYMAHQAAAMPSANVIRECLIEGNAGHGIYLVGQRC